MLVRLLAALILIPLRLGLAILRWVLLLPFPRKVKPYATLRLRGSLPWRAPAHPSWLMGPWASPTVEGIERDLGLAAREERLRGVVVSADTLRADPARLEAVAEALIRFRQAGKEVVLYWRQATAADFILVPAADRILLAPGGMVLLVGHAAALTSLRGGLDKLGILPEFVRIGRWKTAPERFTRPDISEEQRAFVEEVLDHRYGRLVQAVASRRGGDRSWAKEVIDQGPYTSRRALEVGLVDALVYPDEVGRHLLDHPPPPEEAAPAEAPPPPPSEAGPAVRPAAVHRFPPPPTPPIAPGAPTPRREEISPAERRAQEGERALQSLDGLRASRRWQMRWPKVAAPERVAVVELAGLIKPGHSASFPGLPDFAGERTVCEAVDRARRDRRVRGVIVRIDSRGGAAPSSQLMWRSIRRCSQVKPTVAYVESVAASGGYFAAAGAGRIVATHGALVGSIGVFSGRFDARGLFERLGIHQEVILRGANAGLLAPAHRLGDRERELMAQEIEAIYAEFIERVAEGRGRQPEEIRQVAEGRVFVAANAPASLVDEIGDFRTALGWVCAQARLDPARVEVRTQGRRGILGAGGLLDAPAALGDAGPLLLWPGAWEP